MTESVMLDGLRAHVLERALGVRPAGRPIDDVEPCSPLDAFASAAARFEAVLATLDDHEWLAHAHDELGTVRAVVAHLVGVERLVAQWVGAGPEEQQVETEHIGATRAAVAEFATADPRRVREAWSQAAGRAHAACATADPTKPVLVHDLPTDVDGLLVLRAFELWAHLQDVCRATGRACPDVDEPRLALMSGRLMAALPVAVAMRDADLPARRVRVVLTGPAGGCYDLVVGRGEHATGSERERLTIVADTVDVCRVAARRASADDISVVVEGDLSAALVILDALDAFARD